MLAAPARPCVQKKCTFAHASDTGQPDNRRSLRDGLRLIRGLLGAPSPLATVALALVTQGLISASGDRDRTISPSAIRASSWRASRPSHPASRLVTIGRNAPLGEAGPGDII